jgi:DNA-binding response OmpR family regulator
MARILVVEDEMEIARNLRDYLEVAGFEVTVVADGGAARASAPTPRGRASRLRRD